MAFASLLLLLPALAARADWTWNQTLSPHFAISHESAWTPPGFVLRLEKMHSRLGMDLSMFSPWMAKERINLYLYAGKASYVAGEFKPPEWSNGIAMYEKKTLAIYDQPDRKKLLEIISHETTHLLFEGYWGELKKTPPSWLNEGLAMMEEADSAATPESSDWFKAMAFVQPSQLTPMGKFVSIRPTQDLADNKEKVGAWYIQAYSVVYFLYRQHTRLQFKNFNARLRDGEGLEDALRSVYMFHDLGEFEAAWRTWLANPSHKRRAQKAMAAQSSEEPEAGKFKVIKDFKSLRD